MRAHNPPLNRVLQLQDCFPRLWDESKQPEDLRDVGPGNAELPCEVGPSSSLNAVNAVLPLLSHDYGVTVQFLLATDRDARLTS